MYMHWLANRILNEIYALEIPTALDSLIDSSFDPEPTQVGRVHLSQEEKERCLIQGLYLYFGGGWTHRRSMPSKSQSPSVGKMLLTDSLAFGKTSLVATLLPVRLQWAGSYYACQALVNSGAEENFLDLNLARKLKILVVSLTHPISVSALGG